MLFFCMQNYNHRGFCASWLCIACVWSCAFSYRFDSKLSQYSIFCSACVCTSRLPSIWSKNYLLVCAYDFFFLLVHLPNQSVTLGLWLQRKQTDRHAEKKEPTITNQQIHQWILTANFNIDFSLANSMRMIWHQRATKKKKIYIYRKYWITELVVCSRVNMCARLCVISFWLSISECDFMPLI